MGSTQKNSDTMFVDRGAEAEEGVDFPSSWKKDLSVTEREVQTQPCKVKNSGRTKNIP